MSWHVERAIVEAIQPGQRQTLEAISGLAGISTDTVRRHLPQLLNTGVIQREGSGKKGSFIYRINFREAVSAGYILGRTGGKVVT